MKKLILAVVLLASPVLASQVLVLPIWAQTKLTPKNATARVDNCAPIGRTANGELVYSMKCDNIPAPPAPPPQAEATEPPAPPAPEIQRSGLFGLSYEVKRPDQWSVWPAAMGTVEMTNELRENCEKAKWAN
jgi:hypothetical protein